MASGAFLGPLADDNGVPLAIPTLWALTFGNGHEGGARDTLFFAAGVNYEQHGLFGAIQAPQRRGADTAGPGAFDPNAPGEAGDYPLPPRDGPALQERGADARLATAVLLPLTESSLVLVPTLTTSVQPKQRAETPAPTAPVAAISLQGPGLTPLTASGTTLLLPTANDFPPPRDTENSFLVLNTFLDLNPAQTLPVQPGDQRADTRPDAVGLNRSPSAGGDVGAASSLAEPHTENAEFQARRRVVSDQELPIRDEPADPVSATVNRHAFTPDANRLEPAGGPTAGNGDGEAPNGGSVKSLLVAVSTSVIGLFGVALVWQAPLRRRRQPCSRPGLRSGAGWPEAPKPPEGRK